MSTDTKSPQLNRDELHQLKWLLGGVLALISVWTVFYLEIEEWTILLTASAGIIFGLTRPDLVARVPKWTGPVVFALVVGALAYDLHQSATLLPPLIRLAIWLLLYRCVSPRAKRDDLQIIVLGLFLIVVAGVLTVSLAFAGQILLFTAGALIFLFVVTLVESTGGDISSGSGSGQTSRPDSRLTGGVPVWTQLGWRRLLRRLREVGDWRMLGFASALFIGVVAVAALLFLAIPRFQLENSFFLDQLIKRGTRTGFTDSIHLGDVVNIEQDNSVAMRVEVSDPSKLPAVPYWRMVVLDEYRDGSFRMSGNLRSELERRNETRLALPGSWRPRTAVPVTWTFYLEPGISRYLPLTGPFGGLRFREPQQVQVSDRMRLVALRNEPASMVAYRVEDMDVSGRMYDRSAATLLVPGPARTVPGRNAVLYPWTTLQTTVSATDRAALQAAVADITHGAPMTAAQFAQSASGWLRLHHDYALQVTIPAAGRDPTVAWLGTDLPGHCELFAVAFTLLGRTAGYPVRVVTGFKGGDWNAFENYLMVRNANAHAWCEMLDEHGIWFRVDPTEGAHGSGGGVETAAETGARGHTDKSWTAWVDSLRILWYRRIVSFDQRSQAEMVQKLQEATRNSGQALRTTLEHWTMAVRAWLASPWNFRRILDWGAVIAAGCAMAWAWRQLGAAWWARRMLGRRKDGLDPVRREAGRWLVRLRPPDRLETAAVIMELERLRYGPRETWHPPRQVFQRARRLAGQRPAIQNERLKKKEKES